MAEANVLTYPAVTAATELETWRLEYVNATTVQLGRLGGTGTSQRGIITIDGATHIFSSAPTGSNSGIGNNTPAYVYVRDVSGTLTFSFESTAPTVQTPGAYAVKSGDATRRYVGKLRTDASGQFTADAVWSAHRRFFATQRLVNDLRLSCDNTDPAPLSDQTAKDTVYLLADRGNRISLYNTTSLEWEDLTISSALSINVAGATPSKNYDIFAYGESGKVLTDILAWNTDTARATALTRQDGVWVLSGNASRRYIGTIRTTTDALGRTEDSNARRFVYNEYNQRFRKLYAADTGGSHTYNAASYRAWNGAATAGTSQVLLVVGSPGGQMVRIDGGGWIACGSAGSDYILALGYDSTSSSYSDSRYVNRATTNFLEGHFPNIVAVTTGYHALNLLEYGNASAGNFQIGTLVGGLWA
jgi:hypothetical protein